MGVAVHHLEVALACAMSPIKLWELQVKEKLVDVGCCERKVVDGLFARACSKRTRGNGFKLEEGRLR